MNRYKCWWRLLIKQRLLLSSTTELICPFPAWVSSGSVGSVDIDIGCQAAAAGPNSDFGKKRKPGQSRSEPRSPRWSATRARARYNAPLTLSWYHLSHFSKDFSCQFVIIPGHGRWCHVWHVSSEWPIAASVSCTHRAVFAAFIVWNCKVGWED